MDSKEKIIYYLTFAKTKLDKRNMAHIKAKEEIEEIIREIRQKEIEKKGK